MRKRILTVFGAFGAVLAMALAFANPAWADTQRSMTSGGGGGWHMTTAAALGNYVQAVNTPPAGYQTRWWFDIQSGSGTNSEYWIHPAKSDGTENTSLCMTDSTTDASIHLETCSSAYSNEKYYDRVLTGGSGTVYNIINVYDGQTVNDPVNGPGLNHLSHSDAVFWTINGYTSYNWLQS